MDQPHSPQTDIQPGFLVLQGNRLEHLRDLLVDWLGRYPLAPLENENLLVQSNGMAQWLRLALGRSRDDDGLGVATALDLLLPARWQWQCYRTVLGPEAVPPEAPLDKPRLTWRLVRLLGDPSLVADPVFEPLRHYIDGDERRVFQLAARLADQFDQYQVYRADWLDHWARGDDHLPGPGGDVPGIAPEIPEGSRWQPALWRAVLADLERHPPQDEEHSPVDATHAGRALVHRAFLQASHQLAERPAALPRRIVVFGVSALPPQVIEVLGAVSRWVQVIFCLHNPCRHYWGDIVEDRHLFRSVYRRCGERRIDAALDDHLLHRHAHPLLASWGKQGRDIVRLVDEFDEAPARVESGTVSLNIDLFDDPKGDHALGRIQSDLLELRSLREIEAERRRLDPQDDSLHFTIAHTPLREVEILQDQLLAAFDADPELHPRDVIVMVPDMADYAAAIAAVFGRIERDDPRWLPFAISDRPERETHPMLRALESLLRLPESRLTATDVIDLLEVDALRARFGIAADELDTLQHWIETAGIRWGLDGEHRAGFGLPPGIERNSWRFGMDRLLYAHLGGADGDWRHIVPIGGMEGGSAAVVGPLHALIEAIAQWRRRLAEPDDPAGWVERFEALLDAFFAPEAISVDQSPENPLAERESAVRLRDRLLEAAHGWLADCRSAAFEQPIGIETARSAWLERLDEHRLNQRFLVGAVNFATLMPMRAIPFRHVYLLGMSDEAYPRRQPAADFDLMAGRYRPGDRSRREDDRYLFLEALLSARDRFWISWVGRDVRDDHERPACVLVNQLRDHLDRGWAPPAGSERTAASAALTTDHPLQPFSRAYFDRTRPDLFSYAEEWFRVHQPAPASDRQRPHDPPLAAPSLSDLAVLLSKPWRIYLGRRLDLRPRDELALPENDEPFALGPLDRSRLSGALLGAVLGQLPRDPAEMPNPETLAERLPGWIDAALERIAATGELPLPPFDEPLRREHGEALGRQLSTWAALCRRYPDPQPAFEPGERLGSDDEPPLVGEIADIRSGEDGAVRLRLHAGRLHSRDRLKWHRLVGEWPAHVAAQLGGRPVTTYLISESDARAEDPGERPVTMEPLEPDRARAILRELIGHWRRALDHPLPAEPRAQIAWLIAGSEDRRPADARQGYEAAAAFDADLVRLWPDWRSMLDHPAFPAIARSIYRPIAAATRGAHRDRLPAEDAE